jgi:serine/threonine-protein kinase
MEAAGDHEEGRATTAGYHGAVYEITNPHTGAAFALKTMHLENASDASKTRRALSEGRGACSVDHANVIRVFDLNCEPNGLVWMRTELLEGETIAELLGRLGYFSPIFAISVAIEAAHGLQAVHEAQIVHRDVKPANLFYVLDARALKVIDFSIAKVFPDGVNTTVGRAGLGTPAYMAPEQINGLPPTPLVDIYALGITLWQMLAGRHPWQADLNSTSEMVRKHLTAMPEPLAQVAYLPAEVDRVVMRAVAKNPAERYPTMKAFAQALTELRAWLERAAAEGRVALRVPPGEPAPPGDGRSRRDYFAPRLTPPAEEPPAEPSARVIVDDEPTVHQVPAKHGGTLPLGASLRDARTTVAGDAQRAERTERGTDILPLPPVKHRSADVAPASAATGGAISRATPATPLATMKPASLSTGRHPAALRFRWRSVLLSLSLPRDPPQPPSRLVRPPS